MVKFVLHFLFLVCGLALVVRRGERFYWAALGVFCVGIWANALYGLVQLGYAEATGGANLDEIFVHPITGGISNINLFGAVAGEGIYRPNALTGDPNHLGIELLVPLLVLLPDLPAAGEGSPAARAARHRPHVRARDADRDALAQRHARARLRDARPARSRTGGGCSRRASSCRWSGSP